jgi:hypothetical protein
MHLRNMYEYFPLQTCLRPVSCVPNLASISGLSIFDCPLTFISSDEHKMRNVVGYFTYYIWIKLQIIWSCTFTGEDFKFQIHKNKNYIRRPWFFFCLIKNNEVCLYIMFCIKLKVIWRVYFISHYIVGPTSVYFSFQTFIELIKIENTIYNVLQSINS